MGNTPYSGYKMQLLTAEVMGEDFKTMAWKQPTLRVLDRELHAWMRARRPAR